MGDVAITMGLHLGVHAKKVCQKVHINGYHNLCVHWQNKLGFNQDFKYDWANRNVAFLPPNFFEIMALENKVMHKTIKNCCFDGFEILT